MKPGTHYWLVNDGGEVTELSRDAFVVPVPGDQLAPFSTELRHAADNPHMTVIPLIEQLEYEDAPPVEKVDPRKIDQIISDIAVDCERIYDEQTAGDYTWHGVLARFLTELRDAGANV